MARLNDVPAPLENLESFKRKFMRQNRDIARANSTQSLRIRNLENEMSRLLAENLDLREQNLRLQHEIESGEAQRISAHVNLLKSQLETKLLELGELVCGLVAVPAAEKKTARSHRASRASPNHSPDQRSWKNMCTLSQAVSGQEGKLPTILENKSYPRRTLEHQELLNIMADSPVDTTDSPEIGPPPVSQFVDEDPLKIDLPLRVKNDDSLERSTLDPALSANLEHRRKRKDSIITVDFKKPVRHEPSNDTQESTRSLKTGAKRKLSVREDDEIFGVTGAASSTSPDSFQFTRVGEDKTRNKSSHEAGKSSKKILQDPPASTSVSQHAHVTGRNVSSTRKVLAPKSVNDSPRKAARNPSSDDGKAAKDPVPKFNLAKDRAKEKKQGAIAIKPSAESAPQFVEVQSEPETPAAIDIFSPMSSQPSTTHAESRDTPPPSDLGSGTEAHRPSRRARASVSYAEPNLRDKMRRPTKELVDAVTRDEKSSHGNSIKLEDDVITSMPAVKVEPGTEDAWRRIPNAAAASTENSPLSNKGSVSDTLPSNITSHRKRRESILAQNDADISKLPTRNIMPTLLMEDRKARVTAKEGGNSREAFSAEPGPACDVYEFKGSSPVTEETSAKPKREGFVASRFSRRISTIPTDTVSFEGRHMSDGEGHKPLQDSAAGRRQSALGIRNALPSAQATKEIDRDREKGVKGPLSTNALPEVASATTRNERVSARRRSMML